MTIYSCFLFAFSQEVASVENSTYGIQTGFLGIWAHNEIKLTNLIAFRTEIGFDTQLQSSQNGNRVGFIMAPVFTLEPRWYYNLNKRVQKGRKIAGNHGNFISVKTSYRPDLFLITNEGNVGIYPDLSIVPTWGIRRNIGNHFTFETGLGIGWRYTSVDDDSFLENNSEVLATVRLRFGYRF